MLHALAIGAAVSGAMFAGVVDLFSLVVGCYLIPVWRNYSPR